MPRRPRPWYSTEKRCYMAQVDRRKVRLTEPCAESAANEKLAAQKLKAVLKGPKKDPTAGQLRVADVIERYLRLHKSSYDEEAFEQRRHYLQLFAEAHGRQKVNDRDCLPVHVSEWIASHPEWASDWTKAQVVSIVLRPFNWAAKNRLIPANPFRGVQQSTGEPRRPMTDGEFALVLRHATVWKVRKRSGLSYPNGRKLYPSDMKRRRKPSPAARFRQALIYLRFTGCRPGELCKLKWEHIDFAAGLVRLAKHKTARKTKKMRLIPLHPVVLKLLAVIRAYKQPGDFVFLTHRKTPWNRRTLGQRLLRSRKAAGVPDDAKIYGLRHAFGTRAIVNGCDIKTLSEVMGHTNVRMTEHYVSLAGQQAHLAEAVLKINASTPRADGPRLGWCPGTPEA